MENPESTDFPNVDAETDKAKIASLDKINASMVRHAWQIAEEIGANALLVYVDLIKSRAHIEALLQESHCILAAREKQVLDELKTLRGNGD